MKVSATPRKWLMLGAAVILVIIFAAFRLNQKKQANYFTEKVGRGDIRDVVQATGTINAVTTVNDRVSAGADTFWRNLTRTIDTNDPTCLCTNSTV